MKVLLYGSYIVRNVMRPVGIWENACLVALPARARGTRYRAVLRGVGPRRAQWVDVGGRGARPLTAAERQGGAATAGGAAAKLRRAGRLACGTAAEEDSGSVDGVCARKWRSRSFVRREKANFFLFFFLTLNCMGGEDEIC
jgi:hypothetical protein